MKSKTINTIIIMAVVAVIGIIATVVLSNAASEAKSTADEAVEIPAITIKEDIKKDNVAENPAITIIRLPAVKATVKATEVELGVVKIANATTSESGGAIKFKIVYNSNIDDGIYYFVENLPKSWTISSNYKLDVSGREDDNQLSMEYGRVILNGSNDALIMQARDDNGIVQKEETIIFPALENLIKNVNINMEVGSIGPKKRRYYYSVSDLPKGWTVSVNCENKILINDETFKFGLIECDEYIKSIEFCVTDCNGTVMKELSKTTHCHSISATEAVF